MSWLRKAMASVCLASAVLAGSPGTDLKELFESLDLGELSKPPLWEPELEEYFPAQRGGEKDENGLGSPMVLKSPTWEEFAYHARRGYPIMVEDWGKGMEYEGWTCKDFAAKFPFGYMKAEYIHDLKGFSARDHDTKMIDGELRVNIGNFKPDKKTPWHNFTRPASKRYRDDPKKPITGPYVWHVKDELPPNEKKQVQALFEAPKFMQDPLNMQKMNGSFELWFSPGQGCGAGAHNDGYCDSVVSLQLRGDKKWRKMLEPKMTFLHSYDEFDGGVYQAGLWKPDLGFMNKAGAAVIWPPGYLHETKTQPPPDGECGTAITLQYSFPQPVKFFRAFLPRLSLSSEVSHCLRHAWGVYPTMHVPGIEPTHVVKTMKQQVQTLAKAIDKDSDGLITVEEVQAYLESGESTASRQASRYEPAHRALFYRFQAEDTVAYGDLNDDMVIDRQELWDSLVQWNVVHVRIKEGLKYICTADKEGLWKLEESLDYLRREPASPPRTLRPELQQLFRIETGKNVCNPKKIGSISDGEFYSEVRGRIDSLLRHQAAQRKKTKKAEL